MQNKFHHSKIYILKDIDENFYIGSTTKELISRYLFHVYSSFNSTSRKIYKCFTFDKLKRFEISIHLISLHKFENRKQLREEENKHIEKHKDDPKCLNTFRAWTGIEVDDEYNKNYYNKYSKELKSKQKEYQALHKNEIKTQRKEYGEKTRVLLKSRQRTFYIKNRDKIRKANKMYVGMNRDKVLERKRNYYIKNKENILQYHKEYYNINKSIISEKQSESIVCECGKSYTIYHKQRHFRTKQHQDFLKSNGKEENDKENDVKSNCCSCECGSITTKDNYKRHLKSVKHQLWMTSQKPQE